MFKHLSSSLLLSLLALMGIGLVQVYSSSYIFAAESYGDGLYFFKRQFVFVIFSFFVLLMTAQFPLAWFEKWSWLIWVFTVGLLILTFIPGLGMKAGGASRWIKLPFWGIHFEPSEFLKLSFSLFFASLLTRSENLLSRIHWSILALLIFAPLFLLLKQPDFGSFFIIILVGLFLLFSFGLKWRFIIVSFCTLIPAFYFLVMKVDYRRDRIISFLDPWKDPEQKGFQVIQSMLSFHSGKATGVGLGLGQGKLFFLPEAHTDFTMAVLGEEMGFLGFIFVLSLYGFIILRGFQIAVRCKNLFWRALALGLSITFAVSVFINVGVVLGLIPPKGLSLPFLSYGGSSLVTLCFMFGILLNLERSLIEESSHYYPRKKA